MNPLSFVPEQSLKGHFKQEFKFDAWPNLKTFCFQGKNNFETVKLFQSDQTSFHYETLNKDLPFCKCLVMYGQVCQHKLKLPTKIMMDNISQPESGPSKIKMSVENNFNNFCVPFLTEEPSNVNGKEVSIKKNIPSEVNLFNSREKYAYSGCQNSTTMKNTLVRPKPVHSGEKPFSCDLCDFKTAVKSSLMRHFFIHSGDKPFQCNQCTFKTAIKSSLIRHYLIHTGEKRFQCEHCSFRTGIKSSLTRHNLTHTGEKPFLCDQCYFTTSIKSSLKRHKIIHTGKKPFLCNQCDFKTAIKSSLVRHKLRHVDKKTIASVSNNHSDTIDGPSTGV